jgi:hypothetical protein
MDKKPLIGVSILAVTLLVLGSLTNVVGYQTVKSTAVNDSPLFATRTQRATNQQQNLLTSQYIGMGKGNLLQFPIRDNRTIQIQKTIEQIRTMDENSYNRFICNAINQIRRSNNYKDINIKKFINGLNQLRESKQNIIIYQDSDDDRRTWLFNFVATACWIPGCILLSAILIIILIIYLHNHPNPYLLNNYS